MFSVFYKVALIVNICFLLLPIDAEPITPSLTPVSSVTKTYIYSKHFYYVNMCVLSTTLTPFKKHMHFHSSQMSPSLLTLPVL